MWRSTTATLFLTSALAFGTATDLPRNPESVDFGGFNREKTEELGVVASSSAWGYTDQGRVPRDDKPQDKYVRTDAVACNGLNDLDTVGDITIAPGACPDGSQDITITPACDGTWLDALWVQRVRDDGSFADPEQVSEDQCVTPADIADEARQEFASMTIPAPEATFQGTRPLLVNVHYPAYTTATPVDREVTLLGVSVVIRAEPVEYTWDFDDPYSPGGGTVTTTDPGRPWYDGEPWPDAGWIGHTYTRLGDPDSDSGTSVDDWGNWYRSDVTTALTTTWQGRFRVQGTSAWTDIPGNVTTTSTTTPAAVSEARTRLVCDSAHGSTC
jgi:hypothetical protein